MSRSPTSQADRGGDQRHADLARSAFGLHGRQGLPGDAGADHPASSAASASRSRWRTAWSRSSRRSTTRRPSKAGRHVRRPHHPDRRRAGEGPDARARPSRRCAARSTRKIKLPSSARASDEPFDVTIDRATMIQVRRCAPTSRRRHRLYPRHHVQRADHRRDARRHRASSSKIAPTSSRAVVLDLRNNPGGLLDQAVVGVRRLPRQAARSSRPAAAARGDPALQRPAGDLPRASRWSC